MSCEPLCQTWDSAQDVRQVGFQGHFEVTDPYVLSRPPSGLFVSLPTSPPKAFLRSSCIPPWAIQHCVSSSQEGLFYFSTSGKDFHFFFLPEKNMTLQELSCPHGETMCFLPDSLKGTNFRSPWERSSTCCDPLLQGSLGFSEPGDAGAVFVLRWLL